MGKKRWTIKEFGNLDVVNHIIKELNVDKHIANLLVQRGVKNYDEAKVFFRPELSQLHNPFLMKDMDKAIERIEIAINNNEKILVFGDYDVDGTTAVALVYSFLKSFYSNVDFYIPDRYLEGYGISIKGIDFAYKNNFSLIIVLDCGIKETEKIKYANSKNIDFIICDHHRPGNELPDAYAVLDAKRADCNYPYDELTGCGVGFKVVQAYAKKNNIPFSELEKYLDLVVASIASDIVPITGENRILAYYGLKRINAHPRPGFEAILQYSNIKRKTNDCFNCKDKDFIFNKRLHINDLVFSIGPRINAAGRMESGNNSVKLLISKDIDSACRIAKWINKCNEERKNLDVMITQQALEMIRKEELENGIKRKTTVLYNPQWHKGVIGIVASRLIETYYRPTIVLTKSDDIITGSARSVKDFDIYNAIDACSDFLEHFGGHKYAAGLSLKPENLNAFRNCFEKVVSSTIEERMLTPTIEIDEKINLSDINSKFFRILKQFEPFGPGNMAPFFQTDGIVDTGEAHIVGKNHLKLNIIHPEISGLPYNAIAFQQGEYLDYVSKGKPFNICYHIEENEWNGNKSIQLNIKDIKI